MDIGYGLMANEINEDCSSFAHFSVAFCMYVCICVCYQFSSFLPIFFFFFFRITLEFVSS